MISATVAAYPRRSRWDFDTERAEPGSALPRGSGSERQLCAELEKARIQNLGWRLPGRTVGSVDRLNRARVQRVVRVEIRLQPHPSPKGEVSRQPQVKPPNSSLELLVRLQNRNVDSAGAAGQRASERCRDVGVGCRIDGLDRRTS